jgi:hypothetical protein
VRESGAQGLISRVRHAGRSIPIRVKIGLGFGLIAALAVALLAGVLAAYNVQREHQNAQEDQVVLARHLASIIDEHLEDTLSALTLVAADPTLLTEVQNGDQAALNYRLERLLPTTTRLSALIVVDGGGKMVALSAPDKSLLGRMAQPDSDAGIAMRHQRPLIGAPVRGGLTGLPLVPMTVPIVSADGHAVGALTGTLALARLGDLIESASNETPRYVRVFDRSGTLLVGPDRSQILDRFDDLAAVAASLDGPPAARETIGYNGMRVLATPVSIERSDWVVQVEVPVSQIDAPIRVQLVGAALTALFAFVVATLAGWVTARRLTAPIVALRAAARGIDRGEDVAALLDIHSGDEIEDLAHDLTTLHRNLAARTAERELAQALLHERNTRLEAIQTVNQEITRELSLTNLLELIIHRAAALVGASAATAYIWDDRDDAPAPRAHFGRTDGVWDAHSWLSQGVAVRSVERRTGVMLDLTSADWEGLGLADVAPLEFQVSAASAPRAGLSQPIVYKDDLIGVLTAWRESDAPPFTSQDLDTLSLFAAQAAVAIRNAALYEAVAESNQALESAAQRANELAIAAQAADRAKTD